MNRIFNARRFLGKILLIGLFIFLIGSTTISASPTTQMSTWESLMRQDMLLIAEHYATHIWRATDPGNRRHGGNHIDTPDIDWCPTYFGVNLATVGCWSFSVGDSVNIGVPYRWNGSSPIDDPDLGLYRYAHDSGGYFDEKIANGAAAGDVTTDYDDEGNQQTSPDLETAGVDCVGFINNVWRLNTRVGTSDTSGKTHAIQPETLQSGDILMKFGQQYEDGTPSTEDDDTTGNHVILFNEVCDSTDPACNNIVSSPTRDWCTILNYDQSDPIMGGRLIKVYESSVSYKKVTESIWKVLCTQNYNDAGEFSTLPTKKMVLERVKVKIEGQWIEALDHMTQPGYIARTYFQPKDIIFVIDNSTSMDNGRLEQAEEAAKMFIDLMRPGDRIGVVAFANRAVKIYPSTNYLADGEIDSNRVDMGKKLAAKEALNTIQLDWGTSIGAGLSTAQHLLDSSDHKENHIQIIILMSDGDENTAPYWDDVNVSVPVHAIAIDSVKQTMYDIAKATNGGSYYGHVAGYWMNHISQKIFPDTYQENLVKAAQEQNRPAATLASQEALSSQNGSSVVSLGSTTEETVYIDSTVGKATFSIAWQVGNLDLTLVQPDGTVIDPTVAEADPRIEFATGATYEFYRIDGLQKGEWKVRIFGQSMPGSTMEYSLITSVDDAMILSLDTDKDEYFTGNPIKITTSIEDSFLDTALVPEYIHGASIEVTVEDPDSDPNNDPLPFELLDDGLHDDGAADDGIYANTFSDTNLEGDYEFNVNIEGLTNRDGGFFTREKSRVIHVIKPPTVISSLRTTPNPTNYYNLGYTVTFSEPVTGVDASDFVLTTANITGATVRSVTGSNNVYTVFITADSGTGTIRLDVIDDDSIKDADNNPLGSPGLDNGNFTSGDIYTIDKSTTSTIVTKLQDTDDGFCNADCSLREAISAATPSDTVTFAPLLSNGAIRLGSTLVPVTNIKIDGSALAGPVTISGDSNNDGTADLGAFTINSGVTAVIKGVTVTKSYIGISNSGTLTVTNSSFLNNVGGLGGGISNNGTLTVANSTFSNNSSPNSAGGGGIYNQSTLTVSNSTFIGNSAPRGRGGGIYNAGTLNIFNSTFSGNSAAAAGGGIYNYVGDRLNFANTIIANSSSGGDCVNDRGYIETNINNLVEDGSCSALLSGDPRLDALADNGGPTQTIAPLTGSLAISTGNTAICAAAPVNNQDQRGHSRAGVSCDLGAFEVDDVTVPVVLSSVPAFGNPTNYYYADYTVTFSEPVTGVDISDFSLTATGVSGASITGVSGSGSVYTVIVKTGTGSGTLRLDVVDDDTIGDGSYTLGGTGAGNGNFSTGMAYTIDKSTINMVVSKIADTNDGLCNTDCSLREAIAAATPTDTITFATILSNQTIRPGSTLVLSRNVKIDGSALTVPVTISGDTNNDGTGDLQLFRVNEGVTATLKGLALVKGSATPGGGLYNAGTLSIENATLSGNTSLNEGGAIYNMGVLAVMNSTLSGNTADYGGAIYNEYNTGDLTITGSTLSGNTADEGGAIQNYHVMRVNNSILSNNTASYDGGGVYNYAGLTVMDTTFSHNSALHNGGGILNWPMNDYEDLTITGSTFSDNSATRDGGGIYSYESFSISNSTFSNNMAMYGGGIENKQVLMVTRSTFSGNSASRDGGGILNQNNLTITDSRFENNSATEEGGGILNYYIMSLANSTISGNSSGNGGGIENENTLTVSNSTISGNTATGIGGGILNYDELTITNSTLSGNEASEGAGINNYGQLNYANNIIANSISGGDCVNYGSITRNTKNLVEDGSCSALLSGDPRLDELADNGGSTQTMALLVGSPALDAGDDVICAANPVNNLDQRGTTRPQVVHCDIGAFEATLDLIPTPTPTNTSTSTPTPTNTPTNTPTDTPTPTSTPTATPTFTATSTPTSTPTATSTPIPNRGEDTIGVFQPGNVTFSLRNRNTSGPADITFGFGLPTDIPIVGDWDGDGTSTVGVYRNGTFYLRNHNTTGNADIYFNFGASGDQPIVGDWDGDGDDTIGVFHSSTVTFSLRNENSAGAPDYVFQLGLPGDIAITGDWNRDGKDTTGVFRPSNGYIYLKNTNQTGYSDIDFNYGIAGDKPLTGDWNNDGIDTIGVYRGNTFYLRNSNTAGYADLYFNFGNSGNLPLAGNWDGVPPAMGAQGNNNGTVPLDGVPEEPDAGQIEPDVSYPNPEEDYNPSGQSSLKEAIFHLISYALPGLTDPTELASTPTPTIVPSPESTPFSPPVRVPSHRGCPSGCPGLYR